MYTPNKKIPRGAKQMSAGNILAKNMRIYDPMMMQEFFKLSYIKRLSQHSFSVAASQFCTKCNKTTTLDMSRHKAQFHKSQDLEDPRS